jgi:hypothetical protein
MSDFESLNVKLSETDILFLLILKFKIRRKRMSVSDNFTFRLSKSLIPNVTEQFAIHKTTIKH